MSALFYAPFPVFVKEKCTGHLKADLAKVHHGLSESLVINQTPDRSTNLPRNIKTSGLIYHLSRQKSQNKPDSLKKLVTEVCCILYIYPLLVSSICKS